MRDREIFSGRAEVDRDQLEQIESYVRIETDENIARGMSAEEARAAAWRKFGNGALIREEVYRMNGIAWMDILARDARYGMRMLCRHPVFTVAVLLIARDRHRSEHAAVFSVVNGVLLKPLPYPEPDRIRCQLHTVPQAPQACRAPATICGSLRRCSGPTPRRTGRSTRWVSGARPG